MFFVTKKTPRAESSTTWIEITRERLWRLDSVTPLPGVRKGLVGIEYNKQ